MIPSINDFTSYWNFGDSDESSMYAGILFGENILVLNRQVINMSKLLNDNGRIHNIIINRKIIYVLLDNNNLHVIVAKNFVTHNLVCQDVKNIFSYTDDTFILKINGDVLNSKLQIILQNISVVSNSPSSHTSYNHIHGYNNNNEFFEFYKTNIVPFKMEQNTGIIVDMRITYGTTIMLNNNNIAILCLLNRGIMNEYLELKNVNCVSALSGGRVALVYDDNNAITIVTNNYKKINPESLVPCKSISIPNSPYCAKFNTQNIPYYPKYFMDRFIAFVMSVKYGCNIKLPKYLYFTIADCLR